MKKLLSLIAVLFIFSSCQDEVKFNDPSFQVYRDGALVQAITFIAYKSTNGSVRIEAKSQDETINIKLTNTQVGKYYMASTNVNNWVEYETTFGGNNVFYSSQEEFAPITTIANSILVGGTGYANSNNALTTNSGTGTGMRVKTTTEDGVIKSILIASNGNNYKAGDVITITGGNNDAKFRILSEVQITDNSNNTLSGYFKFNVKNIFNNPAGNELVNFQNGAFYKVPIIPE
jgi:hypothetical protein